MKMGLLPAAMKKIFTLNSSFFTYLSYLCSDSLKRLGKNAARRNA